MDRITVQDYKVLVLANGDTVAAISNAKGHLFEAFIAKLLHEHGFDKPAERNVNVTADGIELDVVVGNTFTKQGAIAEGKAYSTNVKAQALTSFYGKLQMARFEDPGVHGFLFALPRLVADGDEQARKVAARDSQFHYFDAQAIVDSLVSRGLLIPLSSAIALDKLVVSDPAVLITTEGLYSCATILDPGSRLAEYVLVWGESPNKGAPTQVLELLKESAYSGDVPVHSLGTPPNSDELISQNEPEQPVAPIVVSVRGSSSDFEYQFPASPAFFVGRRAIVTKLEEVLGGDRHTFVFNAQSGWGKSSLALKLKLMTERRGGTALVVDSRTASSPQFVVEALRAAAYQAREAGLLEFAADSSWASTKSAVATIGNARWAKKGSPLLVFFDQFENVFQDEEITREFRDLTFLVNELSTPFMIGFAWKTDLVGWTESHPYRLRDEIRTESVQIVVEPMGAKDIEALLRRLEKRLNRTLGRDLRQRLREYSQGLPWLFKKLAGHAIREIEEFGQSQEQLVSEALNVQSLFSSDLAGLQPIEKEALRHVARYAPVSATEVTEKYDGVVIQSLLDRRLLVAVGEKLDTYWDIFRDFLNTGKVPIEDSYTLGLNPQSMTPVLSYVFSQGGEASNTDIATAIGASVGSVVNTARTLRLLGIATSELNRVKLSSEIVNSADKEAALRKVVSQNLRRNRAYSLFVRLAERHSEYITLSAFARELPNAFPAVDAKPNTWSTYARAFSLWFTYAGLGLLQGVALKLPPEGFTGLGNIAVGIRVARFRSLTADGPEHIHVTPGPVFKFISDLTREQRRLGNLPKSAGRAARTALLLKLVDVADDGLLSAVPGALQNSGLNPTRVAEGLRQVKGGGNALDLLQHDPAADIYSVGRIIRDATGSQWKDSTTELIGKHFRTWAKHAGVGVRRARTTERQSKSPKASSVQLELGQQSI